MRSLILHRLFAGGGRIWRSLKSGRGGRLRMSTTSSSSSSSSPWLMLPPGRDSRSGDIIHNFYSLSEQQNLSFGGGFALEDGTRFVGSSHGWLALFNGRTNHLFLTDPLSGRRVDLPPVERLPDPEINLRDGRASVSKVVLSCPGDGEWRALMTFGPGNRLAFCSAGHDEWTPIGTLFHYYIDPYKKFGRSFEDFVYHKPRRYFVCSVTESPFEKVFEYWFVGDDADDPMMFSVDRPTLFEKIPEKFATEFGGSHYIGYLVFVEQMNQLLYVVRFVSEKYPHRTARFAVFRVDDNQLSKKKKFVWVRPVKGASLDGLAIFVGINHSFAVAAADFPHIKPNSIYFTHSNWNFTAPDSGVGCDDIGIFDFETQTVSPCSFYPSSSSSSSSSEDEKRISHPPLWFFPH